MLVKSEVRCVDPLLAQINLAFQIAILVVLSASLLLKRKRMLFLHGVGMLMAMILNAVSLILVMIPSSLALNYTLNTFSSIAILHSSIGTIAEALAVWLVASWRLQSPKYCARRRKAMRVTLALWLGALFMGILIYVTLYTNFIL